MLNRKEGLEPPIKRFEVLGWTTDRGDEFYQGQGLGIYFTRYVAVRRHWTMKPPHPRFSWIRWNKEIVERWLMLRIVINYGINTKQLHVRLWRRDV